jgi:hypothetical protein
MKLKNSEINWFENHLRMIIKKCRQFDFGNAGWELNDIAAHAQILLNTIKGKKYDGRGIQERGE